jgi:hypothetical protein
MTRSKENRQEFISHLRAAAKELGATNPTIPSNLLDSFSPSNALMILLQKPHATNCAGFHAWRAAGRSVRKGAKGAAILVPLGARDDDDKPIFSWRYVFDISDTEELSDSSPRLARELVGA